MSRDLRGVAGMAAAALLLTASPAVAAQRFAAPGGGGSGCSSGSPCSIVTAVSGANNGDEIIITPGDYSLGTTLFLPTNGYAHGVQGQPPPRIHVASSHYIDTGGPGGRLSYVQLDGVIPDPLEVSENTQADQVWVHATGGDACLVYGTLIDAVCWTSDPGGTAVNGAANAAFTPILRNVTAEATASGGIGIEYHTSAPGNITVTADNLIVHGTLKDIQTQADSPAVATVNIDHSNFVTGTPTGTGAHINVTVQQVAAPLFVNAAAGDFSEAAGSPTIDAGITLAANGPFDVLGRPRVINGSTDIGAYEYDPFTGVTLGTKKSKVKKGKAKISIGCPAGTPSPCAGKLTLSFAQGRKDITAGSASFSISTGTTATVKVKLSKKALKRLDKKGKLSTQASAAATDGAGVAITTTGKVKLKG